MEIMDNCLENVYYAVHWSSAAFQANLNYRAANGAFYAACDLLKL